VWRKLGRPAALEVARRRRKRRDERALLRARRPARGIGRKPELPLDARVRVSERLAPVELERDRVRAGAGARERGLDRVARLFGDQRRRDLDLRDQRRELGLVLGDL
jgi:hypothetical protein